MTPQSVDTPKASAQEKADSVPVILDATEPTDSEPTTVDAEAQSLSAVMTPSSPSVSKRLPAPPTPTAATYFTRAADQLRGSGKFWRGSPAEIVFSTFTAIALIAAFILAVVHIPAPVSATGVNNGSGSTGSSPVSNTGGNSQPSITVPPHTTYDAAAPAAPSGNVVNVKLVAQESLVTIASGVAYRAWTFNGTVPGPVVRVRQGQTVNFTLQNNTAMAHSIDFHAAETPWNVNYQAVAAGKSFTFTWKANYPGVFMYHCGTPPVIQHLANGMYGAIIVDPANGWSPAREYVLVQSEFYTRKMADGSYSFDYNKAMAVQPDYVTFNGYTNQYKDAPLTAQLGQRVRLFVVNAGPSEFSAFHVIGAIFADAYADGNPANRTVGNQTVTIPPGGGAVVELTIPAAGLYPFVTHAFANASAGALGVLEIKP